MDSKEKKSFYATKLAQVAIQFKKRGFEAQVFETAQAASEYFFSHVEKTQSVAFGGSKTLTELNIVSTLVEQQYQVIDRSKAGISPEEKEKCERSAFSADIYLASANAVTEQGTIVNIDLWGNRTAAIEYGPKKVYLFVGRNKLCANLEQGISRARNYAAVMNCIRHDKKTPCVTTGTCHNCLSSDRICAILSIIEKCSKPNRISLLLINDELGF